MSAHRLACFLVAVTCVLGALPALAQGGTIAYGQTVSGRVPALDVERWVFSGAVGDRVTIRIVSGNPFFALDPHIRLVGPNGADLVNQASDGHGVALLSGFPLPAAGPYTVVVSSSDDGGGTYSLSLSAVHDTPDVTLAYGQYRADDLMSLAGDEWTFLGTADDVVSISVEAPEADTETVLYAPDGRDVTRGFTFADPGLAHPLALLSAAWLPQSGVYRIVVRPIPNSPFTPPDHYSIRLIYHDQAARQPLIFDRALHGYGDAAGQRWSVDGSAGDVLSARAVGCAPFGPWMTVRDDRDMPLASSGFYVGGSGAAITGFALPSAGTYVVAVRADAEHPEATGEFTLVVTRGAEAPRGGLLRYDDVQVCGGIADEAGEIWIFDGRADDRVTLRARATGFDLVLELLRPDGRLVGTQIGEDVTLGPVWLPDTGTYRIHAYGRLGGLGHYALVLSGPQTRAPSG